MSNEYLKVKNRQDSYITVGFNVGSTHYRSLWGRSGTDNHKNTFVPV